MLSVNRRSVRISRLALCHKMEYNCMDKM